MIRFVREGRDVECYPGENLREVALREGIELYGIKGKLGNCGGCGQCITCFVEVLEGQEPNLLSPLTQVEEQKLRRRPQTWRLACQSLVQQSVVVLTRPQVALPDAGPVIAAAFSMPLPPGPMSWPEPPPAEPEEDVSSEAEAEAAAERSPVKAASATSDEGPRGEMEQR